jgi:hypothetical protein
MQYATRKRFCMLESSPWGSLKRVASIFVQHQHKSAHKVANTCAKGPSCLKPVETDYGWTGNLVGAVREVHTRATHTGVVKILELLDGLRDRADCAGNMAPRSGCRLACCHLSYELPVQCWPNQHCRTLTTHDEAAEKHAGSRKGGRVRTRADNLGAHPVRAASVLILPPHVGWLLCASL